MRVSLSAILLLLWACTLPDVRVGDPSQDGNDRYPPGGPATAGAVSPAAGSSATAPSGISMVSVDCGPAVCSGIKVGSTGAMPCCVSEATGQCGGMMGTSCVPNPATDPECPKISSPLGTLNGCCMAGGTCGVDASPVGRGCQPYSTLSLPGAMAPPLTTCTE